MWFCYFFWCPEKSRMGSTEFNPNLTLTFDVSDCACIHLHGQVPTTHRPILNLIWLTGLEGVGDTLFCSHSHPQIPRYTVTHQQFHIFDVRWNKIFLSPYIIHVWRWDINEVMIYKWYVRHSGDLHLVSQGDDTYLEISQTGQGIWLRKPRHGYIKSHTLSLWTLY